MTFDRLYVWLELVTQCNFGEPWNEIKSEKATTRTIIKKKQLIQLCVEQM